MWTILSCLTVPILCAIINHASNCSNPLDEGGITNTKSKFSSKELKALAKLRSLTIDLESEFDDFILQDDIFIRFLRVNNMDVNAASQMARKIAIWRKENNINSISNETVIDFQESPYTFEGYDFDGRPVLYLQQTKIDLRKLLLAGKRETLVRWWDQMLERGLDKLRLIAASRRPDEERVIQFIVISDFTGFSPALIIDLLRHYESYFPDGLKYYIFINTPRSAVPLLEVFKPTLSTATQQAIKIFGPEKGEWSTFLRSIIPADQIPVRYGGTKIS